MILGGFGTILGARIGEKSKRKIEISMEFLWSKLEAGSSIWEAGEAVRRVGATQLIPGRRGLGVPNIESSEGGSGGRLRKKTPEGN